MAKDTTLQRMVRLETKVDIIIDELKDIKKNIQESEKELEARVLSNEREIASLKSQQKLLIGISGLTGAIIGAIADALARSLGLIQ